jgi:hypothetical protein
MRFVYSVSLLIAICMAILSAGCGSGGTSPATKDAHAESTSCISCHQDPSWKTPGTGINVVTEWNLSAHNTKNGAGCGDCHGTGANHPASCNKCHASGVAFNPIKNPDAEGKCATCHNISNTNNAYSTNRDFNGEVTNTLADHFSTPTLKAYTSGAYNARYVTKNYEKSCRSCHNPHDTSSNMIKLRQWARSGKGDVTALPWRNYDFGRDPARSTATPGATPANSFGADCVRCHTATGHINYLTNNQSIAPAYGGTSKTDGKEVLACNVCHDDGKGYAYGYKRRSVPQVTAYYNKSTVSKMRIRIPVTYPDVGESNLCLNCHVGRENGKIIKELALPALTANKVISPSGPYNFANAGFENSHYLTAGATIFRTSGFEFYSSQYYDNPRTVDGNIIYAHDQIGVGNFKGTGTSGPCITCHMKPGRHTFLPVTKSSNDKLTATATELTSTICANCHSGSNPLYGTLPMSADEINHQREQFHAALAALQALLQYRVAVYFTTTNPYFFKADLVTAARNWVTGPGTGDNNMGAAFNFNLLHHDYGAFAHNRYYSKRLIYDSISWLYDNDIKDTTNTAGYKSDVEAAIQMLFSLNMLTLQQKDEACAYLFSNSATGYDYLEKNFRNWRPGGESLPAPVY